MTGGFRDEIALDQLGEAFDVDAVGLAGIVEPGGGGLFALLECFGQGIDDIVAQEIDGIALGIPGRAVLVGECRFEGVVGTLADQVTFHFGDMRRITAIAKLFVKDAQEDLQDDVAVRFAVGLGIDIEQDDVRTPLHCPLDVGQQHRILDLVFIENLGGPLGGAILRIHRFDVLQQVGEDLDEVGFAGTEEAGYPDGHACRKHWILRVVGGRQEGVEKALEVFRQLLRDNVLVQFLPDALGVALIGFDDAIDWAVDRFGEELPDFHVLDSG